MPVADFIFRIDHLRLINEDSLQLLVKNLSESVGISASPDNVIVFLIDIINKEISSQLSVMAGLEEYIKLYPIEAGFTCKPYRNPVVGDSMILRAWERATARVAEHSITLRRTLQI
jgi:hypothetical protein